MKMRPTIDLGALGPALACDASGIWRSEGDAQKVDFPEDGHASCFRLEDDSFWFAHRNACITSALRGHAFDGPLLDVGGGNGAVSKALENAGIPTVLLEPGPEGARNAKLRGLDNVVCSTLERAGFAAGSFGAAGAFDVIEHVADDAALLRDIHRVLRPGGVLCVTVPAYAWLWSSEDELAGHHRRYTVGGLRSVLEASGFDVRFETYVFAPLTLPMFVMRSLPHRLHRRSEAEIEATASKQHVPSPVARRLMDALLAPELSRIRKGRSVPVGTSCLAVAVRRLDPL